MSTRELTHQQWLDEARERFGPEAMNWRFVCPNCGHVAAVKDWRAVGAPEGAVAFSCVGRWMDGPVMEVGPTAGGPTKGPCNYAGGGLFRMNPVMVTHVNGHRHSVFEFAPADAGKSESEKGEAVSDGDRADVADPAGQGSNGDTGR